MINKMKTLQNSLWQLFVLCAMVFVFSACDSDDDNASVGSDITLISEDWVTCLADQTEPVRIEFSSTGDWSARANVGWITLNPRSGSAGDHISLALTVAENDSFKSRVGTVTIKNPNTGKGVDIIVTQGEKGAVIVFSGENADETGVKLAIDDENQLISAKVNVRSNYDWAITTSDWLTYDPPVRLDNGTYDVTFYADPEKLYAKGGYAAQNAIASFSYVSDTRSPGEKQYEVRFDGIKPNISFSNNEDATVEVVELMDENGEGAYTAVIKVISNIKWNIATTGTASAFCDAEVISNTNTSTKFFNTTNSILVTLKDGKLDTENLEGVLNLVDANSSETPAFPLSINVKGVGDDYIFIDESNFIEAGKDQMTGVYMFAAEGGEMQFKVRASNMDDVDFYLAKVDVTATGVPSIIRSKNVAEGWPSYGGVEPVELQVRSSVATGAYTIWTSARDEMESYGGGDPFANRYFALFAVSKTKYATFDDMFDIEGDDWENGILKEELEGKYIILGQKALVRSFNFYSEQIPENGTELNIGLDGGDITINYETNADPEMNGLSIYKNVNWANQEDPYDWTGDILMGTDAELSTDFSQEGRFILNVKKATSSRTIKCGIAVYVGTDKDYMVRTFTIKQGASN